MDEATLPSSRKPGYPHLESVITLAERWAFGAAVMSLGGLIRTSDRLVVGSVNEWTLIYLGLLLLGFLISAASSVIFIDQMIPKPQRKLVPFLLMLLTVVVVMTSNWYVMSATAKWIDNEYYVKWCPSHPTSDKPACVRFRSSDET